MIHVRLEDDPYKTVVTNGKKEFFVQQIVTLTDPSGNKAIIRFRSQTPSPESCRLPAIVHEYHIHEMVYIASARVAQTYESHGSKYTRLSHVKLMDINTYANRPTM